MKPRSNAALGAGLAVISSILYSSYGIWTKLIGDFFGPFTQGTIRCGLTALFILGIAWVTKQLQPMHWRRDWRWLMYSVLSSVFIASGSYYSILHAGVGISLGVAYIAIVIGMFFFGWLFAGERLTKDKWMATLLGFAGLAMVFGPSLHAVGWLALAAAFASGFASALNIVTSKRIQYGFIQSALIAWVLAVPANLPFIFLFHEHKPSGVHHIEWLYIAFFSIISIVASLAAIKSVKLIEAGVVGILGLLEVVFGIVVGALFFHERPSALVLIGMFLIMLAAAVPYIKDYNARRGTLEEA